MPLLVKRIIHGTSYSSFIDMPIDLVQSFGIRSYDRLIGKLTAHFDEHLNCIAKLDIPFSLDVSYEGIRQKNLRMTANPVTR